MNKIYILFILICIVSGAFAQDTAKAIHLHVEQLVWKDVPPPMPAGTKMAVLEGSPKDEGIFTVRFQLPPHWKLPAHTHPGDERVTVLSGSVYVGFGDVLDTVKATKYHTGSFYINTAGAHHYIFTGAEEAVIQITAAGPWGVNYLEDKK